MNSHSAWSTVPHDPSPRADWASRPRYAPSDFITLLWRERWLMLAVFLAILVLGGAFAFTLKKNYEAHSSVLVQLGQEYIYEPRAGDAARGATPEIDQVVQSETEILSSGQLRERTLQKVGMARVYPEIGLTYTAAGPDEKARLMAQAVEAMGRGLKIASAPDTSVIRLTFEHEDPVVGAKVLNTLLEEYLTYRRTILIHPASPGIERQRVIFEDELAKADTAYQAFLSSNGIGDFEAQKTALSQLLGQIESQKYATDAQLQDRLGRLGALNTQLATVQPEIGIYRDQSGAAAEKLAALRVQREELMGRYRPDARPVKDVEAAIAQMEAGMTSGRTVTDGARRFGINPVHQTIQTEKIQLTAEVAALQQSRIAYDRQAKEATAQLQRLSMLEPTHSQLARDRDVLQDSVRDFAVREQQDQAARQIASESSDNIRIIERATPAAKGKSLRKPVLALSVLFALFSALCAGLVRMFLRPGLPTPASASRTLDLPVLATASVKAR